MQQLAESRSPLSGQSRMVSLDQSMMRRAMAAPYLGRDEERELAVRWKESRDQEALQRITCAHMRLVIAMAARFRKFNLPMSDLIQEGYVGLLEAALRFDPEREVRFSTYATWWVRAAMQDYILRNWSIVRGGTSSAQKALFFNLRRLRARLAHGGEELSPADIYSRISARLGVPIADVEMMDSRFSGPDTSLSAPIAGDESGNAEGIDFLMDDNPLPDEIAEETIDSERRSSWLRQALSVLSERELHIIRTRRLEDEGVTLEALGERLGISKERVRQIESRALEKLKTALLNKHELSAYQA
ncbi:RNA polymerase factor sigma-32 [Brucella endophytica]|uniref:RNA polymerase factor sigma-32 n=2 Tax=Brucella endophytica TaxID=1963359 RepID=A0A916SLF9_9HYPH|nr:RNA polymerase factor sigma-32 [Brucella endophytica]